MSSDPESSSLPSPAVRPGEDASSSESELVGPFTRPRHPLVWPLAVVAVTLVAWVGSLDGCFVFDDFHSVVNNPELRDPGNIPDYFRDTSFFSIYRIGAYRPLTLASYTLTFALFGESPRAMHAGNLLLHVGCTLALYALFVVLLRQHGLVPARAAAALGAIVFGVHPAVSQVVHYVSSRAESLAFLGISVALSCHAASFALPAGGRRRLLRLASVLSIALALASKETGILVLPLLVAVDLALARDGLLSWRRVARIAPAVLLVGLYFWWRFGDALPGSIHQATSAPAGVHLDHSAPIVDRLRACLVYWRLSFFPAGLAMMRELSPVPSPGSHAAFAALVLSSGLAGSLYLLLRSGAQRVLGLAGVFYLVPLLPYLIVKLHLAVNENRLYAPLCGLALAAAVLAARLLQRSGPVVVRRLLAVATLALLASALVADGLISRRWASEERIWRQAISVSPHSGDIRAGLGTAFMRRQEWAEARPLFHEALRYQPRQRHVLYDNLGIASYWLGEKEEALRYFVRAWQVKPDSIEVLNNLGSLLHELGRPEEALRHLDRAVEVSPSYCEPRIEALLVLRSLDRPTAARRRLGAMPSHCRRDPRLSELREWVDSSR